MQKVTPGYSDAFNISDYKVQFKVFIEKNKKYVTVNAFCKTQLIYKPKWKTELVSYSHGGTCFFTVWINVTDKNCESKMGYD
jgi:hypothetical protein